MTTDARRRATERRAIFWSAALVAAIALLGLLFLPTMGVIWVVLLAFAVAAVPQALRSHASRATLGVAACPTEVIALSLAADARRSVRR